MSHFKQEKPLPGFPRIEKFRVKEEIDSYLAGENIQCLLCGKWLRVLNRLHLTPVHGISTVNYKKMYGIPPEREMRGKKPQPKKDKNGNIIGEEVEKPWKYGRKDMERILKRMRDENRLLMDVCKDPDMPSVWVWRNYVKKRPDLKKQRQKIQHCLPYPLQARTKDLSPRFITECQRLREMDKNVTEIGAAMNVSPTVITRVLTKILGNFKRKESKKRALIFMPEDYEAVLDRMRDQQRTLTDVCGDPDLPYLAYFTKHRTGNRRFENKLRKIVQSQPYGLQMKSGMLSPRFNIDCLRLRRQSMTLKKIAEVLGCSAGPVRRVVRANPISGFPKRLIPDRKLRIEHYEAILERMRTQQRTMKDVCGDKDLPCYESWLNYKKKHPEMAEKYLRVLWSLPIHVQMKSGSPSPEIIAMVELLRSSGMTQKAIGERLGLIIPSVAAFLKKNKKNKSGA